MCAAARRALGRKNLCEHSSEADCATRSAGHGLERWIARAALLDRSCIRVFSRIAIIESRLIREDDEDIRFDEIGNQRSERVVVAEADFIDRDRIVLVDDRNDA